MRIRAHNKRFCLSRFARHFRHVELAGVSVHQSHGLIDQERAEAAKKLQEAEPPRKIEAMFSVIREDS